MDNYFDNQTPENGSSSDQGTGYNDPNGSSANPADMSGMNTGKTSGEGKSPQETADGWSQGATNNAQTYSYGNAQNYEKPQNNPYGSSGYNQNSYGTNGYNANNYNQNSYGGNGYQQNYNNNYTSSNYTSGNYNTNYNNNYSNNTNYNNPYNGMDTTPLSMGEWLLTILAAVIPCAGIILYLIWAFSSSGNLHRRNFCRAYLIVELIGVVLVFIFAMATAASGAYYYY